MAPAMSEHPTPDSRSLKELPDTVCDLPPVSASSQQDTLGRHGDLVTGLKSTPKSVPCSYLYDAHGSALYDKVCLVQKWVPF